jgi:hypothetical protein
VERSTLITRLFWPRSLPAITSTVSPVLINISVVRCPLSVVRDRLLFATDRGQWSMDLLNYFAR